MQNLALLEPFLKNYKLIPQVNLPDPTNEQKKWWSDQNNYF